MSERPLEHGEIGVMQNIPSDWGHPFYNGGLVEVWEGPHLANLCDEDGVVREKNAIRYSAKVPGVGKPLIGWWAFKLNQLRRLTDSDKEQEQEKSVEAH